MEMSQVWLEDNITKLATTIRDVFAGISNVGKYANLSSNNIDKQALVENLEKIGKRRVQRITI